MGKEKTKKTEELLKIVKELKKTFGNITLDEIVEKLKSEEQLKGSKKQSPYEELRDYLIGQLIKSLIKRGIIEKNEPTTLESLNKIDLKSAINKYCEYAGKLNDDFSIKEFHTAYLFYDEGGEALSYLQECIQECIDKWGLNKDIDEFTTYDKKLSLNKVKFRWIYNILVDNCGCESRRGSIIKVLEEKYQDDIFCEFTLKKMYDFMENPYDFDEDSEVQYVEIERANNFSPTEKEFFLLAWKFFFMEYEGYEEY